MAGLAKVHPVAESSGSTRRVKIRGGSAEAGPVGRHGKVATSTVPPEDATER